MHTFIYEIFKKVNNRREGLTQTNNTDKTQMWAVYLCKFCLIQEPILKNTTAKRGLVNRSVLYNMHGTT
jgi:hypothetical protein